MVKIKTTRLYIVFFCLTFILGLTACSPAPSSSESTNERLQLDEILDRPFSRHQDDWPHSISDIAPDPRAKFGRLGNGLRYVILPVPDENDGVSIQMNVSAGYNNEAEGQYGIAHLLEHMAFRGARSDTDGSIIHDLQSAGVKYGQDLNGYTSTDNTFYIVNLPSNKWSRLDSALENISKLVTAPNLTEESLQLEKEVVLAELKSLNTVSRRTQRSYRQFSLPEQPREKIEGVGTEESLEAISLSDVEDFYAAHYRPDNIVLVVTGDVKLTQIEKAINRLFADWSADKTAPRSKIETVALNFSNLPATVSYLEENAKTQVNAIENLPFKIGNDMAQTRKKRFSEDIVLSILQQRLDKIIDVDDSVTWITPFKTRYRLYDIRGIHSGAKDYPQMMTYFETERLRMLKYGFTQDEVDFAITSKRVRMENLAEQSDVIDAWSEANRLRNRFTKGRVYTSRLQEREAFEGFVKETSAESFHDVAKEMWGGFKPRYWSQSRKSMSDILEEVMDVPEAVSKLDIDAPITESQSEFKFREFPEVGGVASRDVVSKNIHRLLYENGVRLNYQQRDQEPDNIQIQVTLKSDLPGIVDRYAAISERLSSFSRADIKDTSKQEIDRALIGKKADFYLRLNEDRIEINSSTRPEDLKTALALLATYIADVDLDSEHQEKMILSTESTVKETASGSPLYAGFYKINLVYSNKSPIFKGRWSGSPPVEAKVERDIQNIFESGAIEVGIVGDFDPDVLEAAFVESLGALPKREVIEKTPTPQIEKAVHKEPGLSTFIYGGTEEQMGLFYCWPRPMPQTTEDKVSWWMTDEIMINRFVEALREGIGVTYSPTKVGSSNPVFPNFQFSCFGVQIDPEVETKVHDVLASLIEDIKTDPVDVMELDRAREPQKSLLKKYGDSNLTFVRAVSHAYSQPEKINEYKTRQKALKRLKLNRLNETMVTFFDRSNLHIFRIQHYQSSAPILRAGLKVQSDLGDVEAQYKLGRQLINDPSEAEQKIALELLDKLALDGHENAITKLANFHRGRKQDLKKAAYYLEFSTQSPKNAYELAEMYVWNYTTFPDVSDEKIMALYWRSAEGGWGAAQYGLAERLKDGTFTKRDEVGALKWALISNHTKRGELSVIDEKEIKRFVTGLTQDQIDAAKEQAENWVKANPRGNP